MHNITRLYYERCLKLGLSPIAHDLVMDGFSVQLGKHFYHFRGGFTPFNDIASTSIGMNKFSTNKLLAEAGIPVPNAIAITQGDYKSNNYDLAEIKFPVVVKPTWHSACGHFVVCNIKDKETLVAYIEKNIKHQKCLSIEEFQKGLRSYRVLVFYNKVIGVVERIPAHVVGDGESTIRKLIKEQNIIRKQLKKTIPTGPIQIGEETKILFAEKGITLDYIPSKDETVPLRYICNSTYGGTFTSLKTDIICKENAKLAIRSARALNLNLVGFDVLCEDISKPIAESRGFFIEANTDPDITIHEKSINGIPNPVSKIIIGKLIQQHPFLYIAKYFSNHPYLSLFSKTSAAIAVSLAFLWGLHLYAQ